MRDVDAFVANMRVAGVVAVGPGCTMRTMRIMQRRATVSRKRCVYD